MSYFFNRFFLFSVCFIMLNAPLKAQWDNAILDTVTQNLVPDRVNIKQAFDVDDAGNIHCVWISELDLGSVVNYNRRSSLGDWGDIITLSLSGNASSPVTDLLSGVSRPVVSYILENGDNREVFVAYFNGMEWDNVQITETNYPEYSPTISVGSNGNVHVAWIGETTPANFKIFYTNLIIPSNDFLVEELTQSNLGGFGSGADPFITSSDEEGVIIGYRGGDFSNYAIHLAQKEEVFSNWEYEVLSTPNQDDYTNSIVVKNNRIHILISGNDGFGIGGAGYYLWRENGGNWSTPEKVNIGSNASVGSSLYIDDNGNAHCVWEELSGNFLLGNIHYSNNVNGSWGSIPLITTGNVHYPNLDFDKEGQGFVFAEQEDIESFDINKTEAVLFGGKGIVNALIEVEKDTDLINVFPNPVSTEFSLKPKDKQLIIDRIQLYNESGIQVFEQNIIGDEPIKLNRNQLISGVYFYRVFGQGRLVSGGKILLK